ncbi:hypothetical protein AB0M54_41145 [Actinoplanes sp. NPDC051470]|uniref:hypothetical protein n=1 Tax=unclassified Actinoplanes TaxID=2626549 RepID=UPI00343766EB
MAWYSSLIESEQVSAAPEQAGGQPSPPAISGRAQALFALQGSAGNRAVARLMEPAGHPESEEATVAEPEPPGEFNELSPEESEPMSAPAAEPAGTDTAAPPVSAPSAAPAAPFHIGGPTGLWWLDGFSPAGYKTSATLSTNTPAAGTFAWTVVGPLGLSDPAVATPTVTTTGASTARRDAKISVTRTAGGKTQKASYKLTVLAPDALGHLRNVDAADGAFGYVSHVHYKILDQFGTTLPSAVPINEHFTAAPTADAAGMDWRRGNEGAVLAGPADWMDVIQGESSTHTPTPVGPAHANAGDAVYHWPGEWRVGSLSIGLGRRVKSVTWQKYRGRARHT